MRTATMADDLVLHLPLASAAERRILRGTLLGARAAELAEVRRRGGRFSFGYGTETARETMSEEADHARLRMELLDRLIQALDAADPPDPRAAGG